MSVWSADDEADHQLSAPETTTSSAANVTGESEGMLDSSSELFAVLSLLSRLKSPQPSDLARKRKVKCNPPKGTKKGKGSAASSPKNVSPLDRVKAYPSEHFTVSYNKKLFCSACREEISLKKSVIECHIGSQKHKKGKE